MPKKKILKKKESISSKLSCYNEVVKELSRIDELIKSKEEDVVKLKVKRSNIIKNYFIDSVPFIYSMKTKEIEKLINKLFN